MAKASPKVKTVASNQKVKVGTKVFDTVTIKSLPRGAKTTAIAELYGLAAREKSIKCTGKPYARVKFTVDGNGTYKTKSVRIADPGWYSWNVKVKGTQSSVTATEGCRDARRPCPRCAA